MPLSAEVVGTTSKPFRHHVDLRWILAYSAGIDDTAEAVFSPRPIAHPLFPVCLEWPVILDVRGLGLTAEEARRGVHASHDVTLHRPIRPGEELVTTAAVVGVENGRAGAATWMRLTTTDASGAAVVTTHQRSVMLGVPLVGDERFIDRPAAWSPVDELAEVRQSTVVISAQDAHRYTECARIWNPIHTEWDAAAAAGLPFLLLHGTATLARAVSAVDDLIGDGRRRVARVTGRFATPVPMPCALTISAHTDGRFDVRLPDGHAAITNGRVEWRHSQA